MLSTDVRSPDLPGSRNRLDLTGALAIALGVLGSGLFALSLPPVPDHGYQFYLGQKLLGGAKLYVDVAAADMHPPLFTWFATALEAFARLFASSGLTIYPATVVAFIAAVLFALWRIGPRSNFVLAMFALALLPLAGPFTGQGDHLALVLALPYLAATARSITGNVHNPPVRAFTALTAAFGLAMKPHFALVWAGAELYRARKCGMRSLLRIESVTIGAFFVIYVLATFLITPEFFGLLPWLMKLYPRFAPVSLLSLLFDWRVLLLATGLVASRLHAAESEWKRLSDVLAIAAIAMFVAVLLQGKGWGYHWYPVNALSVVLVGFGLRPYAERMRVVVPILAIGSVVWMNFQVDRTARLLTEPPSYLGQLIETTEKYGDGRPILVLTHNMNAGFPLVNYAGVDWASPYAHLWMIPAIYNASWYHGAPWRLRDSGEWRELEQQMFDRLWQAIETQRPSLLFVQFPLDNGFNTAAYFTTDARFADLFRRSQVLGSVGHYIIVSTRF
jgi:hypothetical protein